jgi:anti-sigma factor RsiW
MHAVVMEGLEGYLAGTLEPAVQREIEAHLHACSSCREEMGSMREISQLFDSLQPEEAPEQSLQPSLGFYAGVLRQIDAQAAKPSTGWFFGWNLAFGRRLVFASLLTLAVLGGYLATHEPESQGMPSPDAILAQQESPSFDAVPAHDNMLVTLTAYEQR